ncbi:MAG: hypothetical protein IJA49_04055 [Oscillospiraceae bacterium]|nr:hypothetical protein [Oscillospiraceae bacterium]
MDIAKFKTMLSDSIIASMLEFMEDCGEDAGFTREDVEKCGEILTHYLESLAVLADPDDQQIMGCVEQAVLALNELSEETDYAMIETEERESIWELIQTSAVECGLQDPADDITEQWREW